jgi:hypothetical protein
MPEEDEVWQITLEGSEVEYTVTSGDTLVDIATHLALAVNLFTSFTAEAVGETIEVEPPFTAEATGSSIELTKTALGAFSVDFEIQPYTLDTNATATSVALSGTPVAGDTWTIALDDGIVTTYSHVVSDGDGTIDTLEEIAEALADLINIDSTNFTAATDGSALVIVNRGGDAFTTSFSITLDPTGTPGAMAVDPDIARTTTVALSGTPTLGDLWTIEVTPDGGSLTSFSYRIGITATSISAGLSGTPVLGHSWIVILDGVEYTHIVSDTSGSLDTLSDIAEGLATQIDGIGTFTATASGNTLTIADTTDTPFRFSYRIDPDGGSTNGAITVFSTDANATLDTLADVAAALAAEIDIPTTDDVSAVAADNVLVIVDRSGASFETIASVSPVSGLVESAVAVSEDAASTTTALLTGTEVEDELWRIRLTVGETIDSYDYEVDAGDDLAAIAAGLASTIHEGANGDYTATSNDDTLVITNLAGDEFATSFTLLLAAGTSGNFDVDAVDPTTTVATLSGEPVLGELWTVQVTPDGDSTTSHSVRIAVSGTLMTTTLGGTPVAGETWSIDLDGNVYDHLVVVSDLVQARATVTMTGTPVTGETWTLTIGSLTPYTIIIGDPYDTGSGSEAVDTLEKIAAAFAVMISNDTSAGDFTATADGAELAIVSDVTPFATSAAVTPVVGTIDAAVTVVESSDALANIAAGLADAVNDADAGYVATTDGESLELSRTDGGSFRMSYRILPDGTGTDGLITIDRADGALDTLANVARALAAEINDNAAADFTVTVDGESLVIVNRAGGTFTTAFEVTLVGGETAGAITIDPVTPTTASVELSGTPVAGETWSIDVDGIVYNYNVQGHAMVTMSGTPVTGETWTVTLDDLTPYDVIIGDSYDTGSGAETVDTLEKIAAALAVMISNDVSASDFTATADGAELAIVSDIAPFETSAEVTYVGASTDAAMTVVESNDALADIATALAAAINADDDDGSATGYAATTSGETLLIVDRAGDSLEVSLSVGPTAAPAMATGVQSAIVTLGGVPVLYDTWTVTVDGTDYPFKVGESGILVTLLGTPQVGEVWTFYLDDGTMTTRLPFTIGQAYDVGGISIVVDELPEIAAALAAAVTPPVTAEIDPETSGGSMTVTATPYGAEDVKVSLAGTPAVSEDWVITIGITEFKYTVDDAGGLDTLEDIADELATLIDGDARFLATDDGTDVKITFADTGQYLATADGSALTIKSTSDPVDEITVSGQITGANIVTLSGTPVVGEDWTIIVDGTPYSHTVAAGPETLAQIATALASAINADSFTALALDDTVQIFSGTSLPFTLAVEIDPDLTPVPDTMPDGLMTVDRPEVDALVAAGPVDTLSDIAEAIATAINEDDRIGVVELSGTVASGEDWTITIGAESYMVTTDATIDTLEEIASGLASAINTAAIFSAEADGTLLSVELPESGFAAVTFSISAGAGTYTIEVPYNFSATADDETLFIVNRDTAVTTFDVSVTIGPNGSEEGVAADPATVAPTTEAVTLAGNPTPGEVWTIDFDGLSYAHTAEAGESLADVATSLAAQIDADDDIAMIRLSGPVAVSEVWEVTIDGNPYSVTVGDLIDSGPESIDTVEDIAAALASAVNAAGLFTAASSGEWLTIDMPTSGPETVTFSISAGTGTYTIGTPYEYSAAVSSNTIFIVKRPGGGFMSAPTVSVTTVNLFKTLPVTATVIFTDSDNTQVTADDPIAGETWTVDIIGTDYSYVVKARSTVTMTGTPAAGEVWNLTIGALTPYSIVIGDNYDTGSGLVTVDTLEEIAAGFAVMINGDAAADDFTVAAVDEVLSIVSDTNTVFTTVARITPAPQDTATIFTGGTPVSGDVYILTIQGVGTHTYSVTIGGFFEIGGVPTKIDTAEEIAGALTFAINDDSTEFTADLANAYVTLGGTVAAGEDWTINVGTESYVVTTDVTIDTLGEIATALATAITADATDGTPTAFTAEANGTVLRIGTTSGVLVPVTFEISDGDGTYAISSAAATIEIINSPPADFTVTASITRVPDSLGGAIEVTDPSTEGVMVVLTGDIREDIAAGLAALIELGGTFDAVAQGVRLFISNPAAETFTVTVEGDAVPSGSVRSASYAQTATVTLSGTPLAGEIWNLLLSTQQYDTAAEQFVTVTQTFSYGVSDDDGSVDTLAEIAARLAAAIQSEASDGFAAISNGADIQIVNRVGITFDAVLDVSPSGSFDITTVVGRSVTMEGTPEIGKTWTLTIGALSPYAIVIGDDYDTGAGLVTVDTLGEIAAAFAVLINGDGAAADYTGRLYTDSRRHAVCRRDRCDDVRHAGNRRDLDIDHRCAVAVRYRCRRRLRHRRGTRDSRHPG